jgi:hypothetical protein
MYDSNVAVLGAVITAPTVAEEAGLNLAYTGSSAATLVYWAVAALIAGGIVLRAARPMLSPAEAVHVR